MDELLKAALEEQKTLLQTKHQEFDQFKTKTSELQSEANERHANLVLEITDLQTKLRNFEAAAQRPASGGVDNALTSEHEMEFKSFLRTGDTSKLRGLEQKTMSTVNDPNGGFWVPVTRSNEMVTRIYETSPMRQLATVLPIGTKSIEFPIDDDEAGAEWVTEMGTRNDTNTPQVGMLEITAHELHARPRATLAMIEDSGFSIDTWLYGKMTDKFSRTENTAFVSGSGVGKPRGILSYPNYDVAGVYQRGCIERIGSSSSGNFTTDMLHDMQNSLKEAYQANATWAFKRSAYGKVAKLKDSQNRPLFGLGLDPATAEQKLMLLGKPVVFFDDLEAAGAGSKSCVYGDFKAGYTIVDRLGISVIRDPYSAPGFQIFDGRKRVGGSCVNFEALKIGVLS